MTQERNCKTCKYYKDGYCENLELKPCYPQKGCEDFSKCEELKKEMVSYWIPVSERLPEVDDYRSCTNHEWNDKAVLYYTDKGIIGLGWYYYSTKCWANLDDRWFERDGQVVAWMPLPEPYKVESEE